MSDRAIRKYESGAKKRKAQQLKCIREEDILSKTPKLTTYFNTTSTDVCERNETLENASEKNQLWETASGFQLQASSNSTVTNDSVSEETEIVMR